MKHLLPLILLSFSLTIGQAQIVASDAGGCIQPEDTWALNGTVGSRNTYLSILFNGEIPCRVIWSTATARWVIEADADLDGSFETPLYTNTFAGAPNPPSLGTGTWVDLGTGCGPLVQFSGAYTQTTLVVAPVTFAFFNGTSESGNIHLKWRTASEQDNKHFVVQRSNDGEDYTILGTLPSKAPGGNASTDLDYTFVDDDPLTGVAYYRLQQVDLDNHFKFSLVIKIDAHDQNRTAIFPNPVKTTFYIRDAGPGVKQYTLTNQAGQTVLAGSTSTNAPVDVSTLKKGIYFLKVNGTTIKVFKE